MTKINHDVLINQTCESVYQALTTKKGLTSWFTPHVSGNGKVGTDWEFSFTQEPFFSWHILAVNSPNLVRWKCNIGPGNAKGTEVQFTLLFTPEKQTMLTISHRGWSGDDPKLEKCINIWRTLTHHLKHYCETGIVKPAYY